MLNNFTLVSWVHFSVFTQQQKKTVESVWTKYNGDEHINKFGISWTKVLFKLARVLLLWLRGSVENKISLSMRLTRDVTFPNIRRLEVCPYMEERSRLQWVQRARACFWPSHTLSEEC